MELSCPGLTRASIFFAKLFDENFFEGMDCRISPRDCLERSLTGNDELVCSRRGKRRGKFSIHSAQAAITPGHHGSKPWAVKACLAAGEVRNAISAFAASGCWLPELIP